MNKKGNVIVGILIILVIIALTSAGVLLLVKSGMLSVKADGGEEAVLDTEFLPYGRSGTLAIKEFKFCGYVSDNFDCVGEGEEFERDSKVYFTFIVESSVYNGDVILVKNYRIKGPDGSTLLEVDEKNNYHYDLKSKKKSELIKFRDYFIVSHEMEPGEYTLDLLIDNSLLNKKVTLTKKFNLVVYDLEEGFYEPFLKFEDEI